MADEVYLSVFDKADGKRVTSYTIVGEIHGKTMDELKEKAAKEYPDAYAVPQTREDWRTGRSAEADSGRAAGTGPRRSGQ